MQFIENQTNLTCTYLCPASDRPAADAILTLEPGAELRLEPFSVMRVRDLEGWDKVVTGAEPVSVSGPLVYTRPEPADDEMQIKIGRELRHADWIRLGTLFDWSLKTLISTLIIAGLLKLVAGGDFADYFLGVLPGAAIGAFLVDVAFLLLRKPGLAEARRIISSRSMVRVLTIDPANLRA